MEGFTTIILAAGMGTRMQSAAAKVLHPLAGKPMIQHVIETVKAAGSTRTVVVVGHQAEKVQQVVGDQAEYAYQKEQMGTGHAVMMAEPLLWDVSGPVLITCGDTPLYRHETFRQIVDEHVATGSDATVLTARVDDAAGYGRIVRGEEGEFQCVVEHKDADEKQLAIREINAGTYCINGQALFSGLRAVTPHNAQGEYYLPDVLTHLLDNGLKVRARPIDDAREALGINDRTQLAEAEAIMQARLKLHWQLHGVTFIDPASTWLDADVRLGRDTVVFPATMLEGRTVIGERVRIGPFVHVREANIGDDSVVEHSHVEGHTVAPGSRIGPHRQLLAQQLPPRFHWLFHNLIDDQTRGEG